MVVCCGIRPEKRNGAGDGNRTHVASLEGWSSTIELRPQPLGGALCPCPCGGSSFTFVTGGVTFAMARATSCYEPIIIHPGNTIMKTRATPWLLAAACAALLTTPVATSAAKHNPSDSRHPAPNGRPVHFRHDYRQYGDHRHHRPPMACYPTPPPPVMYGPPPPPPVVYYPAPPPPVVYCPPPPPPPPVVYYPFYPGFHIVLNF